MNTKNILFYVVLLLVGVGLFGVGAFILKAQELKSVSGICIGIGSGLFGMSIARIIQLRIEDKNPSYRRKMNIEAKDERNVSIVSNAKAKAFDVMGMVFWNSYVHLCFD